MYDKVLSMSWEEFRDSDYIYKSNTEKHVIEIRGSEFEPSDKSLFVIYFNVFTGQIMVALQRTTGVPEFSEYVKNNFIITTTEGIDVDESKYTDIVFVHKVLSEALED